MEILPNSVSPPKAMPRFYLADVNKTLPFYYFFLRDSREAPEGILSLAFSGGL